jgi:hypothetical protein
MLTTRYSLLATKTLSAPAMMSRKRKQGFIGEKNGGRGTPLPAQAGRHRTWKVRKTTP